MNSQRIYNLSSSISHHNNILRTVSCNKVGLVCTGAFDKQCSFFQSSEDGSYVHVKDTHYHDDYIYVVRSDIKDRGFFSGSKDKRIKEQDSGSLLCSYDSSSCKEFPVWLKISSNYYSGFTHREVRAESNTPMPYWDIWYIPVRAKYVNLLGQLLCRESWTYIFVKGTFSHINGL